MKISDEIQQMIEEICDKICKYRQMADTEGWEEDRLFKECCDNCPLMRW